MYDTLKVCVKAIASLHIKSKILLYQQAKKDIRIIVGSGGIPLGGWIGTDINTLNITNKNDWGKLFRPLSIHAILAEHVLEHLSIEEASCSLDNCFNYLTHNGYMRIAVPDGFHPSEKYIQNVMPGGKGSGSMDHKVLYNYKTLTNILESNGFQVILLEYFDEKGEFHFKDWDPYKGMIVRSMRYDPRNREGSMIYSSLIVDAVKVKRKQ